MAIVIINALSVRILHTIFGCFCVHLMIFFSN